MAKESLKEIGVNDNPEGQMEDANLELPSGEIPYQNFPLMSAIGSSSRSCMQS